MDTSGGGVTDQEKRMKREIANSNERRRMQSINAGFQNLRRLLPHSGGEKLSKAAILQHAAELIQQIEQEKSLLYEQNNHLKRILISVKNGTDVSVALEAIDLDAISKITITQPTTNNNNKTNTNKKNVKIKLEREIDSNSSEAVENDDETPPNTTKLYPVNVNKKIKIEPTAATIIGTFDSNNILVSDSSLISPQPASIITTTTIFDDSSVGGDLPPESNARITLGPAAALIEDSKTISTNNNNLNQLNCKSTLGTTTTNITSKSTISAIGASTAIKNNPDCSQQQPSEISGLASPKSSLVSANETAQDRGSQVGSAKAAIALPLEVPYSFETVVTSAMITEKRQNLDTICQAIQQIEGECVFKDGEK